MLNMTDGDVPIDTNETDRRNSAIDQQTSRDDLIGGDGEPAGPPPYDFSHEEKAAEAIVPCASETIQHEKANEIELGEMGSTPNSSEKNMEKSLTLLNGVTLIVGIMIGSGIFASPGGILNHVGSPGMSLVVWVFSGILAMMGAFCYCELGTCIPKSGGEVAYLLVAYGTLPAFLYSWVNALVTRPASLAIISIVFANYLCRCFVPSGEVEPNAWLIKAIAISAIIVISVFNALDTKYGTRIQDVFTAAKLIAIALIIIIGIINFSKGSATDLSLPESMDNTTTTVIKYGSALYLGLFAYDGWNNLNFATEELQNPSRNLPLAIIFATTLVISCYLLVNVSYFAVLTPTQVEESDAVGMLFGREFMGTAGAIILSLFVAASAFGAVNGCAFSGSRLVYAASRDGHLPALLGKVHKKRLTPQFSCAFECFIGCIMVLPGNFETLVDYFSAATWFFYFLTVLGLLVLRYRQPDLHRPFRVWIIIPVLFCILSLFLVVTALIESQVPSLAAFGFILLGVPFWYVWVYRPDRCPDILTAAWWQLRYSTYKNKNNSTADLPQYSVSNDSNIAA